MQVIEQSAQVINHTPNPVIHVESAGRMCYQSHHSQNTEEREAFIKRLIDRGHESVLEHVLMAVRFVTDRGVTHEMVRHRLASYSQESTRYVKYNFDEIKFVRPVAFEPGSRDYCLWVRACLACENAYNAMLEQGVAPQWARSILPNSLKTEIIMSANMREWRHFIRLRGVGTTGKPHPQIQDLTQKMVVYMKRFKPSLSVFLHGIDI